MDVDPLVRARVSGQSDALLLLDGIERHHPDPFRNVSRETVRRQAERAAAVSPGDRSRSIVELMRLGALLGERNGHTGILPLRAEHPRPFSVYPIALHEFEDGVFVVAADPPDLVGRELVAVGGTPLAAVLDAVTPLVPRDNEWTIRALRPRFVAVAEVLQGLGVIESAGSAAFRFGGRGSGLEVELEPLPGPEHLRVLEQPREARGIETVDDGRALHVAYNVTRGDTSAFAAEIARRARIAGADALVLDLRHNAGGDNTSYGPLLEQLETWSVNELKKLTVLISRVTFSAAMQLVVDLEQRTPAVFIGEPTGGSPNQYGDAVSVELDGCGVTARVATIWWTTAGEADERTTREPDLHVGVDSAAFFAGEDPVLAAALERLRSG